jgi:MYXO-CTERM domain-containing protein
MAVIFWHLRPTVGDDDALTVRHLRPPAGDDDALTIRHLRPRVGPGDDDALIVPGALLAGVLTGALAVRRRRRLLSVAALGEPWVTTTR